MEALESSVVHMQEDFAAIKNQSREDIATLRDCIRELERGQEAEVVGLLL